MKIMTRMPIANNADDVQLLNSDADNDMDEDEQNEREELLQHPIYIHCCQCPLKCSWLLSLAIHQE